MFWSDVGRVELTRLLVGGEQRRLRVGRERRRDVGALRALGLLFDLRRDRLGIGVDLAQHVADDVVSERGIEQVVAVEVEAAPLERRLRGPLQELARGVAEELRYVDPFDLALGRRPALRSGAAALAKEVREELVEEAAPTAEPAHPFLGEVDVAQVLDFLGAVGANSHARGDGWAAVPPAEMLFGCHRSLQSFRGLRQRLPDRAAA